MPNLAPVSPTLTNATLRSNVTSTTQVYRQHYDKKKQQNEWEVSAVL